MLNDTPDLKLRRTPARRRWLAVLAVAAVVAAGCGSDDGDDESGSNSSGEETTQAGEGADQGAEGLEPPEVKTIDFAYSAQEPHSLPVEFAKQQGLFEKYGFDAVKTVVMEGTGPSSQALVAGQVDAIVSPGGPILSSLAAGQPFVNVATTVSKMTDALFVVDGIESAEDLKGKSVAVSQFGGESHGAVLLALSALGLEPEDVNIVQVGGQADRIAALSAGSVQAAPVDEAREPDMVDQGHSLLLKLSESGLVLAGQGITFTREFADENPNTVLAFVAAVMEAMQLMYDDPEAAIDGYMEWTQLDNRDQATADVEAFMAVASPDMRGDVAGWEALAEVQVLVNPAVEDVEPADGITFEYLDQLRDLGVTERLGVG